MIESSVTYPAPSPQVVAIERELESRIVRAEHIIVTQLSVSAARPVKIRLHADGSRSFTVHSCSRISRTYNVTCEFVCDCPDTRRRHSGMRPSARPPACKHSIACYILDRALLRLPSGPKTATGRQISPCSGCGERSPNAELTPVQDYHESLAYFEGDMLCPDCLVGSDCW